MWRHFCVIASSSSLAGCSNDKIEASEVNSWLTLSTGLRSTVRPLASAVKVRGTDAMSQAYMRCLAQHSLCGYWLSNSSMLGWCLSRVPYLAELKVRQEPLQNYCFKNSSFLTCCQHIGLCKAFGSTPILCGAQVTERSLAKYLEHDRLLTRILGSVMVSGSASLLW